MRDHPSRGRCTTSLPQMRQARIAVCVGTLLARAGPQTSLKSEYHRTDLDHGAQSIAFATAQGQLAYYRWLQEEGYVRIIRTAPELQRHWDEWNEGPDTAPLGLILGMEGTDPIVTPGQLSTWWSDGLRLAGLAHYGPSHYAHGTGTDGPLSRAGVDLLKGFRERGMILDATHLCDQSMDQALDLFDGRVIASHHNCRALVPGERQLSDRLINRLLRRRAVVGIALDAWMLCPGWKRGTSSPAVVSLEDAVNHIDHVCQLAGDSRHVAIGSDLDGGFGREQTPHELNTIVDLQGLGEILDQRGYKSGEVAAIFHGNWLRLFSQALPQD